MENVITTEVSYTVYVHVTEKYYACAWVGVVSAYTMKALKCKASVPSASRGPLAHVHGLEITCPSDKRTCMSHATKRVLLVSLEPYMAQSTSR